MPQTAPKACKFDEAYDKLKALIVNNRLRPNEHLQIKDVARSLRIGVTPLREALIRLAAEDLVAVHPKRGFFAKYLTADELAELFRFMHALLRSSLQRDLGGSATKNVRDEIERALSGNENARSHVCAALAIEQLYEKIGQLSGNAETLKAVQKFSQRTRTARLTYIGQFEPVEAATSYVRRAADLLAVGDREGIIVEVGRRFDAKMSRLPQLIKEITCEAFSPAHGAHAAELLH